MTILLVAAAALAVFLVLGYFGAPLWAWSVTAAAALVLVDASPGWIALVGAVTLLLSWPPARRLLVTGPALRLASRAVPTVSETERVALEAGTVGVEGEIFSGRPDWRKVLREPPERRLSSEEIAFLEGPVEEACALVDDHAAWTRGDLTPETWAFLAQKGFFGMIIPKEHGGLGFSARAHAAVVTRLASRSIALAVTVMVPNSLGPAELLVHYGTDEQRRRYLPRLARGQELPCFALTEAEAGSDAGAIRSSGVVFRGADGRLALRLDWEKRYITLAPVATLVGLAFQLRDPEGLLGGAADLGITCALVPAETPGVEIGRRHDPLGVPFLNGPTSGRGVIVPVDAIIGGAAGAGQGWRMLMECLAAGRAISLPSMSVGSAKRAARVAGAHAAVRRQFGIPIGRFEGVEEPLARIAGLGWIMEAAQAFTCDAIDAGGKPSVVSAIAKWSETELARRVVADAMDVVGGAGIVLGPRNLLGAWHVAQPIGITVEGANILTRSLIVFGQGVIRSHPHAWDLARAMASRDLREGDRTLAAMMARNVRNACRSVVLGATRGLAARAPVPGVAARYWRRLSWTSARFAVLADLALATFGGDLKRREKLAGHLADVLIWSYLATAVLRRFEREGRRREDEAILRWSAEHCLWNVQQGFERALRNVPHPVLGPLSRVLGATCASINPIGHPPSDALGGAVARILLAPSDARDRLLAGSHLPPGGSDALAALERAFALAADAAAILDRVKAASRGGRLRRAPAEELVDEALAAGIVDESEAAIVREADRARREAVIVDSSERRDPAGRERH